MTSELFKTIAPTLPNQPGIYKYFSNQELVYVGKAKNIKKRVSSYFTKTFTSYKTIALVKSITTIDFTITNTEKDALFLENSLIKEHQPKYNIDLKDDKTYPWIVIKKEPFSRIFLTRRKINDGSEYLGPFTSVHNVRSLLKFIKYQIPHRTCKLNLSDKEIKKGKYKVCLEYHLGNCKAPCTGLQTASDYTNDLVQIRNILKGNLQPVVAHFTTLMQAEVADLAFEKAERYKKKLDYLLQYNTSNGVMNFNVKYTDVCTIKKEDDVAVVNYMVVDNGNIINSHNQPIHLQLDETEEEILQTTIPLLYHKLGSTNTELILAYNLEVGLPNITVHLPKLGDKKKLLDLSQKNANFQLAELQSQKRLHLNSDVTSLAVLQQLQTDLQLQQLPTHIECFDNSNFQGSNAVSAMVCFKNGVASKHDYRHYNVKTVVGINDFATMQEVVQRRYSRLLTEKAALPQLVVIDGGKGQLSAAYEVICNLNLQSTITLVGLAKNIEEIFFVGDTQSIQLPYNGTSLTLLRTMRDAVHKFGITHHRNKRSKAALHTELDDIKGIGKATKDILLKHFKTITKIKAANEKELTSVIGLAKAKVLQVALQTAKQQD